MEELHRNWLEARGHEEHEEHEAMLRQLAVLEKVCCWLRRISLSWTVLALAGASPGALQWTCVCSMSACKCCL